jgi:hypothetical protein
MFSLFLLLLLFVKKAFTPIIPSLLFSQSFVTIISSGYENKSYRFKTSPSPLLKIVSSKNYLLFDYTKTKIDVYEIEHQQNIRIFV